MRVDLDKTGKTVVGDMVVEVIDPNPNPILRAFIWWGTTSR